jgi:hypothetical protein
LLYGTITQEWSEWEVVVYDDHRRCWRVEKRKSKLCSTWQEADMLAGEVNKKIYSHHTSIKLDDHFQEKLDLYEKLISKIAAVGDRRPFEAEFDQAMLIGVE